MYAQDLRRGAALMIASGLLFSTMGALVKYLSPQLSSEMVVFFRSLLGLIALTPLVVHRGAGLLKTRRWRGHLGRGLAGVTAMYCYFYALAHLSLAEAVLLNYSTPLFIPFIAAVWLGEHISGRLWATIALGFGGIVLILKPGLALFTPVSLVGLASGLFSALAMVSIRRLSSSEPALRTVFYFSLVCTVVSAVPLTWSWQTPDPKLWVLLLVMGSVASLAQLLLTRAYAHAPAAQVGPFTYSTVVFAAVIGWLIWGEFPDALSFGGAALVCLAGALTIRFAGPRVLSEAKLAKP